MAFWLLLSCVSACTMPPLPPSLSFFSQSQSSGEFSISGPFLSSSSSYEILIKEDSWLRLTIEPQNHAIEVVLKQGETELQSSRSSAEGTSRLALKLFPGSYSLTFEIEGSAEASTPNSASCEQANLLLNLAIIPLNHLPSYTSKSSLSSFPELTDMFSTFNSTSSFSKTYPPFSLSTSQLSKNLIQKYPFSIPHLPEEFREFGFTGLWQVTFALRKL